jgi:predicted phage terminase large subunit-like protein
LAFVDTPTADWACGAKVGIDRAGHVHILHVKRVRGKWPVLRPLIKALAEQDGERVDVGIEANGTQRGYYDDMVDELPMRRVIRLDARGSKETRASLWGSRLEDGIIHCVRGQWNTEFFDEIDVFPAGAHDDAVDSVSHGYSVVHVPEIMMPTNSPDSRVGRAILERRNRATMG